jgi:hypothetical protein
MTRPPCAFDGPAPPLNRDVENECDGMVNMDRTPKFNAAQIAQIVAANQALTGGQ